MRVNRSIAGWTRFRLRAPLLIAILAISAAACGNHPGERMSYTGNPENGAIIIVQMGCGSCHTIPGIADADGKVGPPLSHFQRRGFIAGLLPNTPENLVHWVQHPQSVVPGNAMPDAGLTDGQARDVAAYLRALR